MGSTGVLTGPAYFYVDEVNGTEWGPFDSDDRAQIDATRRKAARFHWRTATETEG